MAKTTLKNMWIILTSVHDVSGVSQPSLHHAYIMEVGKFSFRPIFHQYWYPRDKLPKSCVVRIEVGWWCGRWTSATTMMIWSGQCKRNACMHITPCTHYNDVTMGTKASQITSLTIVFTQPFIQTQIKENIKALRHWPLCGEFTGDRWIPRKNGQ